MLVDNDVQFARKNCPVDIPQLKTDGFAVPAIQEGDFTITQTCACMQYLAERCGAGLDSAQDKAKAAQLALDAADITTEVFSKKAVFIEKKDGGPSRMETWMNHLEAQYGMVEGAFRFGDEPKYCDYYLYAAAKTVEFLLQKAGTDLFGTGKFKAMFDAMEARKCGKYDGLPFAT